MQSKTYRLASGSLFTIVAIAHLVRSIYQWQLMLSGWEIPLWVSWTAVILTGYLAYNAFTLSD